MAAGNPWLGRVALLVFSAVFAIAFGLTGYWAGLKPLADTLHAAWTVRGWQPVPAQVLDVQLQRHASSEGGATYQVQARYRYTVAGHAYEGQRVGLDPHAKADNLGDWQQRWHRTLQQAQQQGTPITVWVNPRVPAQALIDPDIRWRLQIFRIPFALVFSGVGLAAAWVFGWTLLGPRAPAVDAPPRHSLAKGRWLLWFFTLFWCGVAFPMAALMWTDRNTPPWAKGFIGIFVAVGVGLAYAALHQSRKAWRYQGLAMSVQPPQPCPGQPVQATLHLPARAVQQAGAHGLRLRVAQYRVDEASSGSPERQVEVLDAGTHQQPAADGGMRLTARFTLPGDAPAHGGQRSGERVDWRLELVRADGTLELAYDLPVQAVAPPWTGTDRFDARVDWKAEAPIVPLDSGVVRLPPGVRVAESPGAWALEFDQAAWRWAAVLALALLAAEWWTNGRIQATGLVPPRGFWGRAALLALPLFALHAATRRWTLQVRDDGLRVWHRSWLWSRVLLLPGDASQALVHKLLFATGSGAARQRYHAVHARDAAGTLRRITPALYGAEAAEAAGQAVARAWADRRGRFTPGAQRARATAHSRPALGGLVLLAALAWWLAGPGDARRAAAPQRPPASAAVEQIP